MEAKADREKITLDLRRETKEVLREQAAREHRSMSQQISYLVERAEAEREAPR